MGYLNDFCNDAGARMEEVLVLSESELIVTMSAILKYGILKQGRVLCEWRTGVKGRKIRKGETGIFRGEDQVSASLIVSPTSFSSNTTAATTLLADGHPKRRFDKGTRAFSYTKRSREDESRQPPSGVSVPLRDSILAEIREDASISFQDLDNDILLHIASFLVGNLPKPRQKGDKSKADNTFHMIGANIARRLWGKFGALSKHFRARVCELLLLDADFYLVEEEDYKPTFRWLSKNKIPLGRLRIKVGSCHTNYVRLLLNRCDTSRLETVEAIIEDGTPIAADSIQLIETVETIIEDGTARKPIASDCIPLHELHKEIARQGRSIRKLKINVTEPEGSARSAPLSMYIGHTKMACKEISRMRSLRDLEVVINCYHKPGGKAAELLFKAFLKCAQNHPRLEILTIGGVLGGVKVGIKSKSLKIINFANIGQMVWVTKCICPSLERFRCRDGILGNGIRQYNTEDDFRSRLDEEERLGNVGEVLVGTSQEFYGTIVPDSCVVEFQL
jgi:hypothetical protein